MNNGFYKDLDTNFEKACLLSRQHFSHKELLYMLKNGNIPEKQIAALKFDRVNSFEDAETLIQNLTGCDGKIREAVALKMFQLITEMPETRVFFSKLSPEIFAAAAIDINANICRQVADCVKYLKSDTGFAVMYTKNILQYINQSLEELNNFTPGSKKYVINKQLFKLYWSLETLKDFYEYVDFEMLKNILNTTASLSEYTIREKTAQIAVLSDKFIEIQNKLKNDSNYYVRACFLNH